MKVAVAIPYDPNSVGPIVILLKFFDNYRQGYLKCAESYAEFKKIWCQTLK
jgi:hypothetical protein